ncbi:hypothetical protein Q6350_12125 [Isoptericola sp. b515]|uniref:hypothetical protein n=1 Tax=Isoptericola sp. b515 TaxID=3064652 RepID=UPI002713069E|nr:hypothetical protein [Isoptericola sp. b515]MDO8149177.1 hypothetical protein [Isoptericola sp. b515]
MAPTTVRTAARHRRLAVLTTLTAFGVGALVPAAAAAPTALPLAADGDAYVDQPDHDTALYSVVAPDNAAAQEFVLDVDTTVERVSVWLSSSATEGTITTEIRTDVEEPTSAIATSGIDIAEDLGGSGSGWIDLDYDVSVAGGTGYALVVQADVPSGKVAWHGTKTARPGSLPSWNYDVPYWGGWQQYGGSRAAFHINPTGLEGCGGGCYQVVPDWALRLPVAGLYSNGTDVAPISPSEGWGAEYVPGSNVLEMPDGRWRYLPEGATSPVTVAAGDADAMAQIEESRAWLASGTIPGSTAEERATAERALLSMRALTRPNGAVAAAWHSAWKYSWPRDSSFVAAAFAATGHIEESLRINTFNASTQRADGTWEARTTLDGAGPPDDREWQLDGNGFVPWSIWQWYRAADESSTRDAQLANLYPTVQKAADYSAASLDPDTGLPPASPDYWELGTDTPNLGTAVPLLAGLNAAADLAAETGNADDRDRWSSAADALADGIARTFAPLGYPRTTENPDARESAVGLMAPPFVEAPAGLPDALDASWDALVLPSGGVVPGGSGWGVAWTPSTSFFALAWAGTGNTARATETLDWIVDSRTWLGELPEQVASDGKATSVSPLVWTGALSLLIMSSLDDDPLPTPPTAVAPMSEPTVTATAELRCLDSHAYLAVAAKNEEPDPVAIEIGGDHGTRSFATVAPGTFATATFATREDSVPAGEVEVVASAEIEGETVSTTTTVPYTATDCG